MEAIKTKLSKNKVRVANRGYCHQVKSDQVKQKLQDYKYKSRFSAEAAEGDVTTKDDNNWETDRESMDLEATIANDGVEWADKFIGDKTTSWADIVQRDQRITAALSGGGVLLPLLLTLGSMRHRAPRHYLDLSVAVVVGWCRGHRFGPMQHACQGQFPQCLIQI